MVQNQNKLKNVLIKLSRSLYEAVTAIDKRMQNAYLSKGFLLNFYYSIIDTTSPWRNLAKQFTALFKVLEVFLVVVEFGTSFVICIEIGHLVQRVGQNSWATEKYTNISPRKEY